MQKIQQKVLSFLEKNNMDYRKFDIAENAQLFRDEMCSGLNGQPSTLKMIPTYFNFSNRVKTGKKVIVLDAGGTHLRVALVSFGDDYAPVVHEFYVYDIPGSRNAVTSDEFFDFIARQVKPFCDKSDTIGFCFSYSIEPTEDMDGIVTELGKEIRIEGIIGQKIGESVKNALKRIGCDDNKRVIVVNDSVTTLLGGLIASQGSDFDDYIGFILGTGINASYVESTSNIHKLSTALGSGMMVINTESGAYGKFTQGLIDKAYDQTLNDPGNWIYEKMVSGCYQGGLYYTAFLKAAEAGLLSKHFESKLKSASFLTSKQIDEYVDFPDGDGFLTSCCADQESEDRITLYYLIHALVERSAKFVAANLAAIMLKTEKGRNPLKPVCITIEGSTYYNSRLFRDKLNFYIKQCMNDELGIYCKLNRVENANLTGAAVACLSL